MKIKKMYFISLIIISLLIIAILIYKLSNRQIYVEEHQIGEVIYFDLDNDDKEEKIQLSFDTLSNKNTSDINISNLYSKKEFNINIDDDNYTFLTDEGESVISLGIADINLDNSPELLVCVFDNSISPSYRHWNIYTYNNCNLTFAQKIYDGKIKYNFLTNKLTVKYNLHETARPMTETVSYDIDF